MISIILFLSSLLLINCQESLSICEQIIRNRKKQGYLNNSDYLSSIQKLKSIRHHDCIIQLQPKYEWAQNMSFVMVKFDFQISSRTSCSEILFAQKNVTYNGFWLKQYCLQSDQIIKYGIDVKTYKNLNFHFTRWKQTQMNGLILQALKSPTPYFWPKLYSQLRNPNLKPRIWWQLQQKQDDTVQKHMGLLQIDESQIQISSYVRKMKKRQNKMDYNKKYAHTQFYCNQGNPYFLGSWL